MKLNAKVCPSSFGGHNRQKNPHLIARWTRFRADNLVLDDHVKSNDNKAIPPKTFSPEPPSHAMTEITVRHCHEPIPSISEVVAIMDEIIHSMRTQQKSLRVMPHGESPKTFHHILPVCNYHIDRANEITDYIIQRMIRIVDYYGKWRTLYAYFDGSRRKVQYTELVDFAPFAVRPPPGIDYLDLIDSSQYYDKLDKILKWTWPVTQGDTGNEGLQEEETQERLEDKR